MRPQLALPGTTVPKGDYILEPKYDGIRLLAQVDDGVKLWTRNTNDKAKFCPTVCQELGVLPDDTWLDGEAVVTLPTGEGGYRSDWGSVQSALTNEHHIADNVWYVVFDLLKLRGIDARSLPFGTRRAHLEALFEAMPRNRVLLTPQFEASQANHDVLVNLGYEGTVAKSLVAPYASGQRGRGWIKLKAENTMDAVVTGFKPGKGSRKGQIGALCFSQYRDGELVERGACSGMDDAMRAWLTEHLQELIKKRQVIEVKHNLNMPSGALRNARFLRLRDDKPPEACIWE